MTSTDEVLRGIEIFADLRDDQLEWFALNAEEIRLAPGEALLHEGDPADALFVVLEGEIRGRREKGGADAPAPAPDDLAPASAASAPAPAGA